MLLFALCYLSTVALAYTQSFTARDESPTLGNLSTLEFNVTLSLAALPGIGWAYGANSTVANGTVTNSTSDGPLSLLAVNQSASLNVTVLAGAVYVYGDHGNSSAVNYTAASSQTLRFTCNGTDVANRASSSSGLIGLADGGWADSPLTVHAGLSTVIRKIDVTTRMATGAQNLTSVNATTWRLLDGDSLRSPFQYMSGNSDPWLPTSAYAANISDAQLSRLVAPAGTDGVVLPAGGQVVFHAPAYSSWVSLNATRGPGFGILDIRLSPSVPSSGRINLSGEWYAAERSWFATLNPLLNYTATLFASSGPVALHSVTLYDSGFRLPEPEPESEPAKGGLNVGAVVGGVLGGSVALAALCAVVWLLGRQAQRRRVQREIEEDRGPHWLVDGPVVTPFPPPMPQAQPHTPAGALQTAKDRFIVAALTVWSNLRDTATRRDSAPVPVQAEERVDMVDSEGVTHPMPAVKRPSWPKPWRVADEPEQIPLIRMPQPNPVSTPIDQGWQDVPWRDSK